MRIARLICEGLLVAFLAALVGYPLRHHLVRGLLLAIVVCILGIVLITLIEQRRERRKETSAAAPTQYQQKTANGGYEPASPPPTTADLMAHQDNVRESIKQMERFDDELSGTDAPWESGWEPTEEGVLLWLKRPAGDEASIVECVVSRMSTRWTFNTFPILGWGVSDDECTANFPGQFPGAPIPAVSGQYSYWWVVDYGKAILGTRDAIRVGQGSFQC
ncbi:MAG: hypothetical protein ABSH04_02335 [Acidimicrobiales bacterium]|jgi:hypothetical protein